MANYIHAQSYCAQTPSKLFRTGLTVLKWLWRRMKWVMQVRLSEFRIRLFRLYFFFWCHLFYFIFSGWNSDIASILLLLHLIPPSPPDRKRPGKMSASQAEKHLIIFKKVNLVFTVISCSLLKISVCWANCIVKNYCRENQLKSWFNYYLSFGRD